MEYCLHFATITKSSKLHSIGGVQNIWRRLSIINLVYESLSFISVNHIEGRGQLCQEDIRYLADWVSRLVQNLSEVENLEEKILHPEGELEHILIAERFRSKFPDLLPDFYNQADLKFRATKTERAIKSQFYFAIGLFDRKGLC